MGLVPRKKLYRPTSFSQPRKFQFSTILAVCQKLIVSIINMNLNRINKSLLWNNLKLFKHICNSNLNQIKIPLGCSPLAFIFDIGNQHTLMVQATSRSNISGGSAIIFRQNTLTLENGFLIVPSAQNLITPNHTWITYQCFIVEKFQVSTSN